MTTTSDGIDKTLRRLARISLGLIFLVVLAGSVVRMTGSGMGCPDWPKCFGYYIPPSNEEQVSWQPNREYQKGQMIIKGDRLLVANGSFVSGDTFNERDWSQYDTHNYAIFNVYHTWTEYINRLIGALSGLPILFLGLISLKFIRRDPLIPLMAFGTIVMLGFEAWLGKVVVDSNLQEYRISLHMAGALVIILLLLSLLKRSGGAKSKPVKPWFRWLLLLSLLLIISQVLVGTQVREIVDQFGREGMPRGDIPGNLGGIFFFHRTYAQLMVLLALLLYYLNRKNRFAIPEINAFGILVLAEALSGILLYYAGMPKFLQPAHLLLSFGAVALLYMAWLRTMGHREALTVRV